MNQMNEAPGSGKALGQCGSEGRRAGFGEIIQGIMTNAQHVLGELIAYQTEE